jgi:hypothetical protein
VTHSTFRLQKRRCQRKGMKYEAITLCDRHTKAVDFLNPLPSPQKMLTVASRGWMRGERKIDLPAFRPLCARRSHQYAPCATRTVRGLRQLRPGKAWGAKGAPKLFDRCLTGCVPTMNAGGANGKVFSAVDTLFYPCFATGTR